MPSPPKWLVSHSIEVATGGSRRICPGHHDKDADYDFHILTGNLALVAARLRSEEGYHDPLKTGSSGGVDMGERWGRQGKRDPWLSLYSDGYPQVNLLLTEDFEAWKKIELATQVAEFLVLTDKRHRIVLFEAIMCDHYIGDKL